MKRPLKRPPPPSRNTQVNSNKNNEEDNKSQDDDSFSEKRQPPSRPSPSERRTKPLSDDELKTTPFRIQRIIFDNDLSDTKINIENEIIKDPKKAEFEGPLAAASHYYFKENHIPSTAMEAFMQVFLILLCLTGAYLYFDPANEYANIIGQSNISWLYILGTCYAALTVLYVATDEFFRNRASSVIPETLKKYLKNPQTINQRIIENTFIAVISAMSSIVLTTVLFAYPPKGWPLWGLGIMSVVIFFDNTILHFLPVKLILNEKIWRLPFLFIELPLIYLYKKCKDCKLTSDDLKLRELENIQKTTRQHLKDRIAGRLKLARNKLIRQSMKWQWKTLSWIVKPHDVLKNLSALDDPLVAILKHAEPPGYYCKMPPLLNYFLKGTFMVAGAVWTWAGISGYYAEPFNQFAKWTGNNAAGLFISALPTYALMVLVAFFGKEFAGQLYDYFIKEWGNNINKISVEIKLWPKLFSFFMLFNTGMAAFSYAAAIQLINTQITYPWAKLFIPFLSGCAYSSLPFFCLMAGKQLFETLCGKLALHAGNSDTTRVVFKGMTRINQLINSVQYMKGEALENELTEMSSEVREKITGLTDESYNQLINHEGQFEEQKEQAKLTAQQPSIWARLFCCGKKNKEEEINLLWNGDEGSYGAVVNN